MIHFFIPSAPADWIKVNETTVEYSSLSEEMLDLIDEAGDFFLWEECEDGVECFVPERNYEKPKKEKLFEREIQPIAHFSYVRWSD